jgi:hypothetical protein
MWDLHIVPKLKVARESNHPDDGIIAPGLEQHHRNRAAREDVSDTELCDDVQSNYLVSHGLDHADRNRVYEFWAHQALTLVKNPDEVKQTYG